MRSSLVPSSGLWLLALCCTAIRLTFQLRPASMGLFFLSHKYPWSTGILKVYVFQSNVYDKVKYENIERKMSKVKMSKTKCRKWKCRKQNVENQNAESCWCRKKCRSCWCRKQKCQKWNGRKNVENNNSKTWIIYLFMNILPKYNKYRLSQKWRKQILHK